MRVYVLISCMAVMVAESQCATAVASMKGMFNYTNVLFGTISFVDLFPGVRITGSIAGLPDGQHGLHIHQYGNISEDCSAAGAHYNPYNQTHGSLDSAVRHLGDLGNVYTNLNGDLYFGLFLQNASLTGQYGLVGLTITIHEDVDDLGRGSFSDSYTTGHSGRRVGCGIILQSSAGSAGWYKKPDFAMTWMLAVAASLSAVKSLLHVRP